MGTITERRRKDGSTAYLAQISLTREGKIVFREAQTFDRRPAAAAWLKKREKELAKPGAVLAARKRDPTLGEVIQRYIDDSAHIGKTKGQVLRAIKTHDIAETRCADIGSADLVEYAGWLMERMQPQTVGNYLAHLGAVFAIARPAWQVALDPQSMSDAKRVAKRLGLISKSKGRDRRPTLDELDILLTHFASSRASRVDAIPMVEVVLFALFSTRRQAEITRIKWKDYDREGARTLVRDMKHPGEKVGNDVWCDLPDPAQRIIESRPRTADEVFPHNAESISASFTDACAILGIEDLHFHDLRHEGISRLFEMGWNIPHVAAVSGHRDWKSLKRYTHLRQSGDKYLGWKWLERFSGA
ncbi:site-specific integrase [Methylovirgula sp. 4M-Z18]|uniref:site-specific integrase n=1 Tax=Methylovirgula sp. 4M-Z18 TaxID=2293567 RepID=UPI000E2EBB55|nr:site-specific integrase [Methylovirgula sp. 4M-Z18]RFB80371.1 site-specific integrase [Methylovirgula sp. 4M-Z18]